MSAEDVDAYLRGVGESKRGTLEALRRMILEIVTSRSTDRRRNRS